MGGLFSAPKVVVASAAPAATAVAVPAAVAPEVVAAETRTQSRERSRRGLAGTVVTSARGVFGAAIPIAGRKSLLGE